MTKRPTVAMDGFNKVKPISEGYQVKGGVNTTSRITVRPAPPAPTRPSASSSANTSTSKK